MWSILSLLILVGAIRRRRTV
ncbi:MAG TPA: hypothetical protein DEB46_06245 [Myxococcales bacterium]|nr:hypothetical protein [Myxococcales bacterium]